MTIRLTPERLVALVDSSPEGVALVSADGAIGDSNPAFRRILGTPAPSFFDPIHPEDRARIETAWRDLLARPDGSAELELRVGRSRGAWSWVGALAQNRLDAPDIGAVVVLLRDIGSRKELTSQLTRMGNILSEGQRIAHFGSFEYVAATQETVWSEEEFRIYGLDPAKGSPDYATLLARCIHPDDRELLHRTFGEAMASRGVYELEHRIIRPDGTERIVVDVAHPYFDDDGNLVKYIGTTHDVTERRELEAQLLQSQKLESVGRLAGGIAHDFNNLLIPILGYASFVKEKLRPGSELYEDVEVIEEAGQQAARLTRQILAFSRKQVLQVRVVDLNQVVRDFERLAGRLLGEQIQWTSFLDPNLGRVRVDPGQIEQILLNLSVNARDAMPDGGRLTLETSNVVLDESYVRKHGGQLSPGKYAMLAVSDSGVGMDEATQSRIFEPFFTTKELGRGTGLGLATVFGIVSQHRGSVFVYSELGKGTTFKIYLPETDAAVDRDAPAPSEPAPAGGERILVVEDEDMVRRLVVDTLEADGYAVTGVSTPEEAILRLTRGAEFDLLFTDVVLPKLNGKQLFDRARVTLPALRVLYMSGYTDNVIVHHGILDAGVSFLEKPFAIQALRRKVREVLA
ncbi:MAG: PAS domain-containing protein [Sandaracinaceae bacterium]